MNVTLIADALGPELSGIGRYVLELCRRVPAQGDVERVGYFVHGRYFKKLEPLVWDEVAVDHRSIPTWFQRRWSKRELRRSVIHGPNYFLPPEADNGIITIHDLSVFRYPEMHPAERLRAFEREFTKSLARASHVITDTESVRREVISEFGVAETRVTAVPLGVAPEFRPRRDAEIEPELAALSLSRGEYALCVSTLEPRKKIRELIRAWRELPAIIRNTTPLVLAGAKGWLNDQLLVDIEQGVSEGWLRHLGYVPDGALLALYAGAQLFVYPSIYEGFGLPPVEAMASGVPVVVAGRSCLPEVCGNACMYVDPDDVPSFTAKLEMALADAVWRDRARQIGLERAADFTWERCIGKTMDVYRADW